MTHHLCKPDTAWGPGECGAPATHVVERWPDYGATWDRRVTLYLCAAHAEALGWHYGPMRLIEDVPLTGAKYATVIVDDLEGG